MPHPCRAFCDRVGYCVGGGGAPVGGGGPVDGGGAPSGPSKWTSGETLGLPQGLNLQPLGLAGLLGLDPSGTCDLGVCNPVGEGFGPGLVLAGGIGGTAVCEIAEPCGIFEDVLLGIVLLELAHQVREPEWSSIEVCSEQYETDIGVCQQRKTSSCWASAAERLAICNASGGRRLGIPPLL